jgi:hypothetical protein
MKDKREWNSSLLAGEVPQIKPLGALMEEQNVVRLCRSDLKSCIDMYKEVEYEKQNICSHALVS